ncbi:MAG: lipase family protein [Candidatus Nanoarchaeia archaeon]|jgi:hypothetical protein|nr:lipase family protein [Candidatus Nanoarchaeia archaeon]
MNIIPDVWRYSEAADHGPKALDNFEFLKDKKLTKNDHKECFSYVSEEEKRVVFVFAGTKGNLKSWAKDFLALPLKKDSLINTKTNEPGIIHAGFYELWLKSKQMVDDTLVRAGDKEIVVGGMSQGGALAVLCARHLVKNRNVNKSNLTLVTFGAPAQGIGEYATQVNELLSMHYRVVDGYDIVPTMPPAVAGFVHSGSLIWLKAPWWHKLFIFMKVRAHFYSSYTKGLLKKFTKLEDQTELKIVLKRVSI